jgi:hypothetical protein
MLDQANEQITTLKDKQKQQVKQADELSAKT